MATEKRKWTKKELKKDSVKWDIKDTKEYIAELKQDARRFDLEAQKCRTKLRKQLERLKVKQQLYKTL